MYGHSISHFFALAMGNLFLLTQRKCLSLNFIVLYFFAVCIKAICVSQKIYIAILYDFYLSGVSCFGYSLIKITEPLF